LVLVLRVLVHHGLGIACTRRPAVGLVRELVLLMRRAVLRLVWLRVRASHWRHCLASVMTRSIVIFYLLDPGCI
jgi:hypothetical protein